MVQVFKFGWPTYFAQISCNENVTAIGKSYVKKIEEQGELWLAALTIKRALQNCISFFLQKTNDRMLFKSK